jgi:GPH family glycoside/pentoside/hexuronide:cation symporter
MAAPLSRPILAAYGLPGLFFAALTLPLYVVLPTFYAESVGVPLAAAGAILFLVRVFDAFNDPVIGWLADRSADSARRKRWTGAAALPLALCALALFWPPSGAGGAWLFAFAALLSVFHTAATLPYLAWGAELSPDMHERSRIAAFRESFVLVGTVIATILPFAVGWSDPSSLHGMAILGLVVAVGLPIAIAGALLVAPSPPAAPRPARLRPLAALRALRTNPHFTRLLSAFALNSLANAFPATLFLLFVSQRLEAEEWRGGLLVVYFLAAIAGVPFFAWLSRRHGKNRVWRLAMTAACLLFLPAAFLGPSGLPVFAAICIATGFLLGADLALPASMQADAIEAGEIATGDGQAALCFALWGLATKISLALAVGIAFPLLGLAGLDAEVAAGSVSPLALGLLSLLYAGAPVALKIAAIALIRGYRLDEAEMARLRLGAQPLRERPAPVIAATTGK